MFNFPLCRSLSTRLIDDDSITGDTGQNVPVETQNLSRVECLINPLQHNQE